MRLGEPSAREHIDAEIAAALTLTTRSAAVLQDLALGVTRLPGTLKALAAGRIDQPRAAVIASGTSALDDKAAGIVSALVIRAASGQTTGQLRASVQQAVIEAEPGQRHRPRRDRRQRKHDDPGHVPAQCHILQHEAPVQQRLAFRVIGRRHSGSVLAGRSQLRP